MLTRPADLSEERIRVGLVAGWDFAPDTLEYLTVGFGSHHWLATSAGGRQLFLSVHDLPAMLHSRLDTAGDAFGRLVTAFQAAGSLRRHNGLEFVVAPLPAVDGGVIRRLSARYTLSVCPYLADCEPGRAGEFLASDRPAVVGLLTALHRASPRLRPAPCDFGLQNADALRLAMASAGDPWRTGPYGEQARALLTRHAVAVTRLMAAYRELADAVSLRRDRFVVTHGEPGPWNVLKTAAGLVIVDWDSVRLAPPERDLWQLAEYDREALTAYSRATGTVLDDDALSLFRMWYDLSEIAGYIDLFRTPHEDTEDAAESWRNLVHFLRPAERWPQLRRPVKR